MGDALQLALDGGVDAWVVVPVQVRPDGGVGIKILAPLASRSTAPRPDTITIGSRLSQSRIWVKGCQT